LGLESLSKPINLHTADATMVRTVSTPTFVTFAMVAEKTGHDTPPNNAIETQTFKRLCSK